MAVVNIAGVQEVDVAGGIPVFFVRRGIDLHRAAVARIDPESFRAVLVPGTVGRILGIGGVIVAAVIQTAVEITVAVS